MFQICLKKCLLLENLKTLCHRHMLLLILNMNKLLEHFTKKELQKKQKKTKKNQKEFGVERVLKRKDDKLYIKWKGSSSFNSWIDRKDRT